MSRYKTAEDWLEWAQAKYEAAQERYAFASTRDTSTLDSYSELVSVIERGIRRDLAPGAPEDTGALAALADQMETLGKGGFAFNPQSMVDAAHAIRKAMGM